MKNLLRISFVAALWVASAGTSFAQWSSDPAVNTLLSSDDSTYMYGEFRGDALHSAYYHVYYKKVEDVTINSVILMQKYDHSGVSQWEGEGITLYGGPNKTWVPGLELAIDNDGNVYVAYAKVIPMGADTLTHMCLNKVAPDGTLQWGADGVDVSDAGAFGDYDAVMRITTGNNILLAYDNGVVDETMQNILSSVKAQMLDTDGNLLWTYTLPRNEAVMNWSPELEQLPDNNIMLLYKYDTLSLFHDTAIIHLQQLYTRVLDPSGVPVYQAPVSVFAYDTIVNEPPMARQKMMITTDGELYFTATKANEDNEFQIYLQKLDATGHNLWAQPSVVSTRGLENVERGEYSLTWLDASSEMVILWIEKDYHMPTEAKNTIMAQKFDNAGNTLWADTGMVIQPTTYMAEDRYGWLRAQNSEDGNYIAFWMHYSIPDDQVNVMAEKLDGSGNPVWASVVAMSTRSDMKQGLWVTVEVGEEFVATWNQEPVHPGEPTVCFAQNIRTNGDIGTGIRHTEAALSHLTVYPNPAGAGTVIHVSGQQPFSNRTVVTLYNTQGRTVMCRTLTTATGNAIDLLLPELSSGVYMVQVSDGINNYSGKFLVE